MGREATSEPPFNAEAWFERLHALNFWACAQGLALPGPEDFDTFGHSTGEAFRAALRAECMRRFQAGMEEWNRWAEEMLALKAELEAAGLWQVEKRFELVETTLIWSSTRPMR